MRINQNISAMTTYRAMASHQNGVAKATERLSSGLRINRAADDAAGLSISEGLRSQVNGLAQASRNGLDGVSLLQTAEGNLNETHAALQRMRTLAVQAANGTNSPDNLQHIQAEMTQLMREIDRIADSTEFNGIPLLDGTFQKKSLQVGANAGERKLVTIASSKMEAVSPQPAQLALWNLDQDAERAKLPNPLVVEHGLDTSGEKVTATIDLTPIPANVTDLAAQLNAHPEFSASFQATTGNIRAADGTLRPSANIIIAAKQPGKGAVTVPGVGDLYTKTRTGRDEVPEQYGGYHAAELLGPIDITRQAGSEDYKYTSPGGSGYEGFGDADLTPRPPSTVEGTRTWGSGADDAITRIDRAIAIVSEGRAEMGATQNALSHTINNVGVAGENLAISESRIRDADMAKEMTTMKKQQILLEASMSMLAQVNKVPQTVLSLLQ